MDDKLDGVVIWFRENLAEAEELAAAKKYFHTVDRVTKIKPGELVIQRYSALPFFKEQAENVEYIGAKLLNSFQNHNYISQLENWYYDLEDLTPKTWFNIADIPDDGPFFLKGQTNSRKFDFKTHCYAINKLAAQEVHWRLCKDALIIGSDQDIVIRKFEQLDTIEAGMNGLPISHEFRFFIAFGKILCGGYYWCDCISDEKLIPDISEVPMELIQEVIRRVGDKSPFWVLDVAKKIDGTFCIIELNCGTMSGLSGLGIKAGHNPEILYSNLRKAIEESKIL